MYSRAENEKLASLTMPGLFLNLFILGHDHTVPFMLLPWPSRKGITAVLNLTEAGEHPYCGDGLEESSGFPYLPEIFMQEGSKSSCRLLE